MVGARGTDDSSTRRVGIVSAASTRSHGMPRCRSAGVFVAAIPRPERSLMSLPRGDLHGRRPTGLTVAILATDGVERGELEAPRGALYGAGARTELLSIHDGEIAARQMDLDPAGWYQVDRQV